MHSFIIFSLELLLRESEINGGYNITREMVSDVKKVSKKVHVEEVIPSVIEPSFGIGRIFYSLLEHTFR